jgi:GMP synthase (glutamine-hydrolysing)
MPQPHRFLIVDGYPVESRDEFDRVGMRKAGVLYRDMLLALLPDAEHHIWYSSDDAEPAADAAALAAFSGVLWPGCNLTVYHDDPRVHKHTDLCRRAFALGVPQFGSCYAIQLACFVAGGEVAAHPGGREMGVNHGVALTDAGRAHPMFDGKPAVFAHLHSHDDEVKRLPAEGATLLAANAWCVQAAEVRFGKGVFWGVQYHPEYDLHEMACLIHARKPRLIKQGLFRDDADAAAYAGVLDAIFADPGRKDLRWQYKVGDDVIDDRLRTLEFRNWLRHQIGAEIE